MNNIQYPKPDYKNQFYNCYKNGDNPVLVFAGIINGSLYQWYEIDKATNDALKWAEKATGQTASPYRGLVLTLPDFSGWRVFFGARFISVKRTNATCEGVRFERLADVQRFRAAVVKTVDILR